MVWALANGYFENRVRELRIQAVDVQKERDDRSRRFALEKAQYDGRISVLRERLSSLQQQVTDLDVPVVGNVFVFDPPWHDRGLKGTNAKGELFLSGTNFGDEPGRVQVVVVIKTFRTSEATPWPLSP